MSKLNKLVTNYPVSLSEEEIENLSATLAPVVAACGGGGGGTGGKIYTGIGFVSVNNSTNQIGLTEAANTKLNQDIPTKVSDLSDSANYQTVAGMTNYLTTATYEADSATFLTQTSASQNLAPISVTADVETLKEASGDFSEYYKKTETSSNSQLSNKFNQYAKQSDLTATIFLVNGKQDKLTFGYDENNYISSIDGSALAGQGGTTYTPGQYIDITNDEISVTGVVAIDKTSAYDPILLGDANITAVSSRVNNRTTWNLSVNATPVVTDTKLTGDNCVTAHTTETSGEWAVGLVQSAYQAIDSVGVIATDVGTLKTASANWNKVSDKLDTTAFSNVSGTFLTTIPDTYATKDYANNASANALSEAESWVESQHYLTEVPNTYATKTDLNTASSTLTGVDNALSGHIDYVSAHAITSLDNYYTKTQVDSTFASATQLNDYLTTSDAATTYQPKGNYAPESVTATINTLTAASARWDDVSAKLGTAQYANDSATFVTSSNSTIIGTKQYALTTAGWAVVSTPTIPDITANNGLSANGHTIGIDNTNLVADTQYAWTTTGWSDIGLSAYLPLSGGTVSGQLTVSGNGFNNNLHLKRDNNDGFIGLANNGAITFKNIVNGSTSQIEFLTSANKTFDITVKDNSSTPQPVGKLYVMSAHSLADATATSANWANDGMLHIILES